MNLNQGYLFFDELLLTSAIAQIHNHKIVGVVAFQGMGKTCFLKKLCFEHLNGLMIELRNKTSCVELFLEIEKYKNCKYIFIDNIHLLENKLDVQFFERLLDQFTQISFIVSSNVQMDAINSIEKVNLKEMTKPQSLEILHQRLLSNGFPKLSEEDKEHFYQLTLGFPLAISSLIDQLLEGLSSMDDLGAEDSYFLRQLNEMMTNSNLSLLEKDSYDILIYMSLNKGQILVKELKAMALIEDLSKALKKLIHFNLITPLAPGEFALYGMISKLLLSQCSCLESYIKILCQFKLKQLKDYQKELFDQVDDLAKQAKCERLQIDVIIKFAEIDLSYYKRDSQYFEKIGDLIDLQLEYRYQELLLIYIKIQFQKTPHKHLANRIQEIQSDQYRHYYQGYFDFVLNRSSSSVIELLKAITILEDMDMKFLSHTMIAFNSFSLAQNELAIDHFKEADKLLQHCRDQKSQLVYYKFKTIFLSYCGKYQEALVLLKHGIELAKSTKTHKILISLLWCKSMIYSNQKKLDEALSICKEALNVALKVEDTTNMISLYDQMANIQFMKQSFDQAIKYQELAIQKCFENQEMHRNAELYCRLACIQTRQLKFKEAQESFAKSYDDLSTCDNQTQRVFIDLNYSEFLLLSEKYQEAIEHLKKLVIEAENCRLNETKSHALYYLSKAYHLLGDLENEESIDLQYNLCMDDLEQQIQDQLVQDIAWFENHISTYLNRICIFKENEKVYISENNLKSQKKQLLNYDLYINFIDQSAYLYQEKLSFFSKKTLVKVFQYLLIHHQREVKVKELFQAIWKREYNPEIDSQLRVAIIRLRKLLLDSEKKTLIASPHKNSYQLNFPPSYCIITRL